MVLARLLLHSTSPLPPLRHHQIHPPLPLLFPCSPSLHLPHLLLHQLRNPSPPPRFQPNTFLSTFATTCIPLITSCSTKTHLLQIHARLLRSSLVDNPSITTAFLSRAALSPLGDINYSRRVFEQIPKPTVFHYNTMLRSYSQDSTPEEALHLYNRMRKLGISPNTFTSSFALKSCTRISYLSGGKQMHARVLQDGHQSDSLLLTTLMGLYVECGDADDARRVFDEMPERDIVAWNVLISCYCRNHRTKDALRLFDVMRGPEYGLEPDDVTCLLLLQACAHLGALDFGEMIHKYAEERGFGGALNIRNSLVAMYSRCGCVDKAYRVFCDTPHKNVISWSAMISGLAMNGYGRYAIEAFREMTRVDIAPDDQTFTGVLSACSHSGLVDEGFRFFDMMRFKYRLVPNVCHYGCMIDLLGRAGLLDQAYEFIVKEMKVQPDATIWRTLLGACRIHGHVDLGERVIGHLIELKAQQAGDYVLLLNIYASVGNWEKVVETRRLMKEKGIQTTPGCSTIELNGEVHEFVVDDNSHPQKAEIYEKLDEIGRQLKIAGYVANMASELHDMDMEEKESALCFHSEKLAIAFGILATPPGRTIRIAKNLRICVDCHTFAKVLSSVYNRLVIIRDRSRFHHFKEGCCSCNDYW
ncbi:pentatricopeptide repeat-containing protein At3g47530 [Phoenix dactylifera]|uniref:Pentatricopeptide repeat-containing protein At3g47530 n=1 Tax=Phoenix dactylifera TaxID=42345 RepID=A0A8B7BX17_PHODC|nr:pentatricopeptide repeat-containing protein At3g47530 [Phoenix dactylifera]XP_026658898.1 pentatricopeptide repeat-containing protein At3g47530 [Phoenix dactylifera]XP_026658899.1 pentatricopeptide repeat-containing protein At3g47530 [Phoenix dactylifera]XP_038983162.1 pentatricopeptide repeat-containing protein At3g47530 [Phoenix dactylifera]